MNFFEETQKLFALMGIEFEVQIGQFSNEIIIEDDVMYPLWDDDGIGYDHEEMDVSIIFSFAKDGRFIRKYIC